MMNNIAGNYSRIQERIGNAAQRCGRQPEEITLVAVSKTHGSDQIEEAISAGVRVFGENRVQEILQKFDPPPIPDVELHMIGHLQSNKVKDAVRLSSWIQSVDSEKLLRKISSQAESQDKNMDICIEMNTSGQDSKFGLRTADELFHLLETAENLPAIRLRGLMTIGPLLSDGEVPVRRAFASLRKDFGECVGRFHLPHWDSLSMGMSNDFEIAVEEGSTMVRVGSSIFGPREYA